MAGNPALGRRAYVRCKALREGGAEEGGREGEARAREIEKVGESERCVFVLPEVQYNLLRRTKPLAGFAAVGAELPGSGVQFDRAESLVLFCTKVL